MDDTLSLFLNMTDYFNLFSVLLFMQRFFAQIDLRQTNK